MSNSDYKESYSSILDKIEYIKTNNYLYFTNKNGLLDDLTNNLKLNSLSYNKSSGLLNQKKKCLALDIENMILDDLNKIYDYANKVEIHGAPKSLTFCIQINTDDFWL